MTTDDRTDTGALARARAQSCAVPDWHRVARVTYEGTARFDYDDGRPAWELPGIEEEM